MTAVEVAITRIVEQAPPLSPEQTARLRALLAPAVEGVAA